jgi:hypothetical protein
MSSVLEELSLAAIQDARVEEQLFALLSAALGEVFPRSTKK